MRKSLTAVTAAGSKALGSAIWPMTRTSEGVCAPTVNGERASIVAAPAANKALRDKFSNFMNILP